MKISAISERQRAHLYMYKKQKNVKRFYIHKKGKKVLFKYGVLKKIQLLRAILSNKNEILHLLTNSIIQ